MNSLGLSMFQSTSDKNHGDMDDWTAAMDVNASSLRLLTYQQLYQRLMDPLQSSIVH